jgi:acyl-CoA synthetase (AMP-forming)/AMP-acid ligase II
MAVPLVAAATLATGAYLNAKYNIVNDIKALYGTKIYTAKVVQSLYERHGENDWSLYHLIHDTYTRRGPEATKMEALVFEGRSWTYHDLVTDIAKMERKLKELNVQCGDMVSMIVNNSPEFMITIFALWKIGAVPAPINTSLTSDPLKHCLAITHTKCIITTNELLPAIASTVQEYAAETPGTTIVCYDYDTYPMLPFYPFDVTHVQHSTLPPGITTFHERPRRIPEDPCMLLYTSGTTGRPKAVKWPCGFSMMTKHSKWPYLHRDSDRWYCALPCFHGTATWACICPVWGQGGTIVLARKFSTSKFWGDVVAGRCNAVIYIGEMGRYLSQAPVSKALVPNEREGHNVEKMFGLGMSAKSWEILRERFGIDTIAEYWSATEATGLLINVNRNSFGLGMTGRQAPLMRYFNRNIVIVKRDFETEELLRDPKTGLCVLCGVDEPGEVLTKVDTGGGILLRHSYLDNEKATNEKVVRGVFAKDDEYTRIGDLMVRDKDGFIKFVDRLGHGWRNKGHNISASEVESVLATHPAVVSTSAFPIAMSKYGYEGQLGCCVLTVTPGTTEQVIHAMEDYMIKGGLPLYAIPRFLRIVETDAVGVSAVFKKQKEDYKAIGKSGITLAIALANDAQDLNLEMRMWCTGSSRRKMATRNSSRIR